MTAESHSVFRRNLQRLNREHPLHQGPHPFWRRCFRGTLPADAIRRWATDNYPMVRDFPRLYCHVATKCLDQEALTFLGDTIFEETGSGKVREAHWRLFQVFMEGFGVDLQALPSEPESASAREFWQLEWSLCREASFLEGMACVGIGVESPLPHFFPMLGKVLKQHYGLNDEHIHFFTLHGKADLKHSSIAAKILAEHGADTAAQKRIREIAFHMWDLQKRHLDELNSFWPEDVEAAVPA